MTLPLVVLAGLSVVGGYAGCSAKLAGWVALLVPEAEGSAHTTILLVSLVVMTLGAGSALVFYKSAATDTLEEKSAGLRRADLAQGIVRPRLQLLCREDPAALRHAAELPRADLPRRPDHPRARRGGRARRLRRPGLYTGSLHTYVYWFLLGAALLWAFAAGVF
jgi:NADH-quinone oxidoreductase subunit L